mgnify:CR=1 FL=1
MADDRWRRAAEGRSNTLPSAIREPHHRGRDHGVVAPTGGGDPRHRPVVLVEHVAGQHHQTLGPRLVARLDQGDGGWGVKGCDEVADRARAAGFLRRVVAGGALFTGLGFGLHALPVTVPLQSGSPGVEDAANDIVMV